MNVDIYQSVRQLAKFIAVRSGQDVTDNSVVAITDADFKSIQPFKMGVPISTALVGTDANEAIKDIQDHNYHIFGHRIEVTVQINK
ncbi:hypothetical protein ABNP39_07985 [Pantoea dispersa]|uniref:hypothetical protein n=1 Tax=Pantoea dispersa TaxID=59814 RepID=UPI0032ECAC5A